MTITASAIKGAIITEIGDVNPLTGGAPTSPGAGLLATQIDFLWARWAAKDLVAPGLRELYAKRSGLELVLSVLLPRRIDVQDSAAGLGAKGNQIVAGYERKLDRVQAEIDRIEALASRVGASSLRAARIAAASPVVPRYGPDPSSQRYGGTALRRRSGRL